MSLTRRLTHLMRMRAHTALNRVGQRSSTRNGSEGHSQLDAAQLALFEATAAAERLEREGRRLQAEAATLFDRAMDERAAGREAAATEVLARRALIEPELDALRTQHGEAVAEVARLAARLEQLRG